MKKLLFILMVSLTLLGCNRQKAEIDSPKHRMLEEIVINYSDTDSVYKYYGYYKMVFRKYNYEYQDSFMRATTIDSCHGIDFFINEYNDTVCCIYVDYTNYPKREE